MSVIRRVYVVKRPEAAVEAKGLLRELREVMLIQTIKDLRIFNRYDFQGLSEAEMNEVSRQVLSEAPLDEIYAADYDFSDFDWFLAVEALPGQYDQRADSAAQCAQILNLKEKPECRTARVYAFQGALSDDERARIRNWLINPIENREASPAYPDSLTWDRAGATVVPLLKGFRAMDEQALEAFYRSQNLAMTLADLRLIQTYFQDEGREPTETELKVLDTYWSDHCRHSTFNTSLSLVSTAVGSEAEQEQAAAVQRALSLFKDSQSGRETPKDFCLMQLATLATKLLKLRTDLSDLDESEEINACSVHCPVLTEHGSEDYLLMFKNETHNHPTEIEPFGGAATCLGGAIRDPLSGRAYVYQAMRVSGAADPREALNETLPGKLPQRKICQAAARGYSSYGNQIGLATGQVRELYHPGYKAKRMELGAVVAAAPAANVQRLRPEAGDLVILLGGRTGRDGVGGATGSSKAHSEDSLSSCGAEVQKGNPVCERKLQRLFRKPEFARRIKRCNDFGAGGVAVAIGELADGLDIYLDEVRLKYAGLAGTELAISESQERMAIVIAPEDRDCMLQMAETENLEAYVLAEVNDSARLRMFWQKQTLVDLSREFLNTNGAKQLAEAELPTIDEQALQAYYRGEKPQSAAETLKTAFKSLRLASQKGLGEQFDSSIGAASILAPYGGRYQLSPEAGMAALIPAPGSETASLMSFGFDPYLSEISPYHGAYDAVLVSLSKILAMGQDPQKARLSLQEYFERMKDAKCWGKVLAALTGAFQAQLDFGTAAIGGKDSMSGSFEDIHVPPTLVSFAVASCAARDVRSACLSEKQTVIYRWKRPLDAQGRFAAATWLDQAQKLHALASEEEDAVLIPSAFDCAVESLIMAAAGNHLGLKMLCEDELLWAKQPGQILLALPQLLPEDQVKACGLDLIAELVSEPVLMLEQERIDLKELWADSLTVLDSVYPLSDKEKRDQQLKQKEGQSWPRLQARTSLKTDVRVLIPCFPGTNCEWDMQRAFQEAGAKADIHLIRNLNSGILGQSLRELATALDQAQILALPGGFSAGDEPEGSGKFILSVFRNPYVREALERFLAQRDGLILGICNGFQALIKLGLLPYGHICDQTEASPTLTYNRSGRHIARYVNCRVFSNRSPWLRGLEPGSEQMVPISHGEGRLLADEASLKRLVEQDQIAICYAPNGKEPEQLWNPNDSCAAIEAICSPDGRILGKMAHSERTGRWVGKNIPGEKDQQIFRSGVSYFD